jgi:dimethylamine/trimethylamine dehydrogenase
MGNVIAEKLAIDGLNVTIVTSANLLSPFSEMTMESTKIYRRMVELNIEIVTGATLSKINKDSVTISSVIVDHSRQVDCDSVILVTARETVSDVYDQIIARQPEWEDAGITSVQRIGDCLAPGTIAAAVYSGHRYARELESDIAIDAVPFKRPLIDLFNNG